MFKKVIYIIIIFLGFKDTHKETKRWIEDIKGNTD